MLLPTSRQQAEQRRPLRLRRLASARRRRDRARARGTPAASLLWLSSASGRPLFSAPQRQPVVARHRVLHAARRRRFSMSSRPISACLSNRLTTTVTRSRAVALPQRRRHPAGVAHRRQLLVGDDDDRRAPDRARRAPRHPSAARRARCSGSSAAANSSRLRIALHVHGSRPARVGRGQQVRRRQASGTTRPLKNASSRRCDVLERVDDREPRLGAEEHRGVAVREVQVDEQQRPAAAALELGRDVHRHRGRADAALGADEREHLPGRDRLLVGQTRLIAVSSSAACIGSARHSFTPARIASSISGIERRRDDHTGVVGCWRLRVASAAGKPASAHVDDHDVGLVRGGMRQHRELAHRQLVAAQVDRPEQALKLPESLAPMMTTS